MLDHSSVSYNLTQNVHRITLYNTVASQHQHADMRPRLYLHVDMNCFYAQVEQQSYNLYGIPLIVGGWRKPDGTPRGIVATSSYEARQFGIKTGMSAFEAQKLCPYIVFMQVHYEKYQAISRDINRALNRFSPDVEAYSMDEYFLDISFLLHKERSQIEQFGQAIKQTIYECSRLISSVGISYSKTYAKLASDLQKPDGLTLILNQHDTEEKIYPLNLNEVWGIGQKRSEKLKQDGLNTIEDAFNRGVGTFKRLFGDYFGKMLFETVTGKDRAKVMNYTNHVPKEITYMHTFSDWTTDIDRIHGELTKAVRQIAYRMRGYRKRARDYNGCIRFQDVVWKGVSFKFTTEGYTNLDEYIIEAAWEEALPLITRFLLEGHRIRGIGLSTIKLDHTNQIDLFFQEDDRLYNRYKAVDLINNTFGFNTILPAADTLDVKGKTHFLDR